MDYRIEKKDAFTLICKKKQVTAPQGDTATADISAFWNEVSADGTTGVYCVDGENASFRPIELVYQGEGYALVKPAEGVRNCSGPVSMKLCSSSSFSSAPLIVMVTSWLLNGWVA